MAEQRASGDVSAKLPCGSASIVFILTSIAWRESWKYGNRAYRYCLLDIGHAWQALALSAAAAGYESLAVGRFCDDEVGRACRLPEDQWPMLAVALHGGPRIPLGTPDVPATVWHGGEANQTFASRYHLSADRTNS